jgi:hypothetical protein
MKMRNLSELQTLKLDDSYGEEIELYPDEIERILIKILNFVDQNNIWVDFKQPLVFLCLPSGKNKGENNG